VAQLAWAVTAQVHRVGAVWLRAAPYVARDALAALAAALADVGAPAGAR
jgi:hypothetical protein